VNGQMRGIAVRIGGLLARFQPFLEMKPRLQMILVSICKSVSDTKRALELLTESIRSQISKAEIKKLRSDLYRTSQELAIKGSKVQSGN
jgi:hypothetical protein